MEKYEKSISLKTIGLTFARRYDGILFIFLPILLASFLVTNFMMTKTYQSSISVSNNAAISTTQHQQMGNLLKDKDVLTQTAHNLKADGYKHANGADITSAEISSGVNLAALASNSISLTITFQSTDQSITKYVLDELIDLAVPVARETIGGFAALTVDNPASAGVKNSKENRYFLIAAAAGLVVALAVPFVYEIIADEVYDAKDITDWGVPATLIDASKGVKVEKGSKEEEAK